MPPNCTGCSFICAWWNVGRFHAPHVVVAWQAPFVDTDMKAFHSPVPRPRLSGLPIVFEPKKPMNTRPGSPTLMVGWMAVDDSPSALTRTGFVHGNAPSSGVASRAVLVTIE